MIISNSTLNALRTTFSLQFAQAYDAIPTWYDKLCTTIPSNSKSNTYGWKPNQTILRQWIGPRQAQNVTEREYAIVNNKYEGTVELDRTDIEDDNLGVFSTQTIPDLAQAAKKHPDQLVAALLAANPTGYDGVSFFAASGSPHPNYNATGTGATTYFNDYGTLDLIADNFITVFSGMVSIVGENGQPLLIRPNLLIVPPQLEYKARVIMQSGFYALPGNAGGASATAENVLKGWCDILVIPELATAPKTWYLADTSKPIKPLIYQTRDPVELVQRQNLEDPKVFEQDKFTWGVRVRDNVGAALPFLMAKATTA